MMLRVDPRSAEPIFEQLVYQVKRAVARGELAEGDRLPSVREIARELTVNPNTVVRAIEVLARDGVVVRRQGAGTFVAGRGGDELAPAVRRERLAALLRRTVTEAYHLGFDADAIRMALDRSLKDLHPPQEHA